MTVESFVSWWPLFLSVAGCITWGIRLEGAIKLQRQELGQLREQLESHAGTAVQIAVLQEQIKNLTAMVERLVQRSV